MARHVKGMAADIWQERLEQFESGRLCVRAFCEREGVSQASFYNWRRRLAGTKRTPSSKTKPAFHEIELTTTADAAALAIELPGGARLQVAAGQLELARAVVREVALAAQAGAGGGA